MVREDYLMRQVASLGQVLARILRLRTAGEVSTAQADCARALREIFSCEPDFLALLDASHVLESLHLTSAAAPSEPVRDLARVAAELLDEYGRLEHAAGRADAAAPLHAHACAIRARMEPPATRAPVQ